MGNFNLYFYDVIVYKYKKILYKPNKYNVFWCNQTVIYSLITRLQLRSITHYYGEIMTLHSQRFATETLIRLSEKIPDIEIILEYSVKPYRIYAYLPEYNISIEIDENDHAVYDPEKEFERSRYITNTLHCSWIRVNNSDSIENTVEQL